MGREVIPAAAELAPAAEPTARRRRRRCQRAAGRCRPPAAGRARIGQPGWRFLLRRARAVLHPAPNSLTSPRQTVHSPKGPGQRRAHHKAPGTRRTRERRATMARTASGRIGVALHESGAAEPARGDRAGRPARRRDRLADHRRGRAGRDGRSSRPRRRRPAGSGWARRSSRSTRATRSSLCSRRWWSPRWRRVASGSASGRATAEHRGDSASPSSGRWSTCGTTSACCGGRCRRARCRLPGRRFTGPGEVPAPPGVPVMISALRPASYRLAGEISDGALAWICPLPYLRDRALPALRRRGSAGRGRAAAGRALLRGGHEDAAAVRRGRPRAPGRIRPLVPLPGDVRRWPASRKRARAR